MASQARKRTAAQRNAKPEEDTRPISEEEQDAEINHLKRKAEEDKYTGRMYLDILVFICIFVSGRQAYRYIEQGRSQPLIIVTVLQTLLLPLSLSPNRLGPLADFISSKHAFVTGAQLILFSVNFMILRSQEQPDMSELLRWALPELVAGAVEIQRRAEKQNAIALAKLENLRYNLKGA